MTETGIVPAYHLGLDVGSTTVKAVMLDADGQIIWKRYIRHLSEGRRMLIQLLYDIHQAFPEVSATVAVTGSGGIGVSREMNVLFVQEVVASTQSIRRLIPEIDVAIELGGEDAKITFFDSSIEQRMNETCAGGTGAFIDQMASYLKTDPGGLNELAKHYKILYPIASRCGVFAKTDIMPLLNEGAAREDIAASIFQAVVDQTVSGLACGRAIEGKVAFLGGPLFFLSSLRERFIDTLKLTPDNVVFPENAHYFVAIGAALTSTDSTPEALASILSRAQQQLKGGLQETRPLPPLFESVDEQQAFIGRHARLQAPRIMLSRFRGDAYLGIDSGSTTIKAVLIDVSGNILYTDYKTSHGGNPLQGAIEIVKDIYRQLPEGVVIHGVGVTGYGGALLKAALRADIEEVETVAHFKGVQFFLPDVSFILDIGGQDMKCLHVKNGFIDKIMLNEACSAGCGSFIQTFAQSVDMPLDAFIEAAKTAKNPVDLGSRCTVFMNSKVKQAQKEGASIGDIAAGLSYSVVRNALYKVIKIASPDELGDKIAVQGGAFLNDALLRAFELLVGREVYRPDIAGLMGAFGAAKLAAEQAKPGVSSRFVSLEELEAFKVKTHVTRCGRCGNRCLLTINRFPDGCRHVSGNRCEKGGGKKTDTPDYPNLFQYKYKRLFEYYHPLSPDAAARGTIGIPRALNMYENYPFWFTLLTNLGFRVILSSPSSKEIFALGMSSIPSQTVCYPAKLAHGHVLDLIRRGVNTIFYPSIFQERPEEFEVDAHYNCPVVIGYPELLKLNIDALDTVRYLYPFVPLDHDEKLARSLTEVFSYLSIPLTEMREAVCAARSEMERYRADVRAEGVRTIRWIEDHGSMGVILAGHPYHLDPEVHHGLPELITANGAAVLTEDSVAHLHRQPMGLRMRDQWTYHSRMYRAAAVAASHERLELVECTSFGCGLDALSSDQVGEVLSAANKIHTLLKIDEGENLGAARIRIRSLLAAVNDRHPPTEIKTEKPIVFYKKQPFTQSMRKTHTIIFPQMSPIHFQFTQSIFEPEGYRVKLLPTVSDEAIEEGLRYVNNDACYPAIVVIGQLLYAIKTGEVDPAYSAFMISETGGACRASNYVSFLRKALVDAGYPNIPIISFSMKGADHPGFHATFSMARRLLLATMYGDLLSRLSNRTRPYELEAGITDQRVNYWARQCAADIAAPRLKRFGTLVREIIADFTALPIHNQKKPKVGLVGEILLKYHPDANNHVIRLIEKEGGEAVSTDMLDFFLYCAFDPIFKHQHLSGRWWDAQRGHLFTWIAERMRRVIRKALDKNPRFSVPLTIRELAEKGNQIVSLGQQAGEGWLLTAEMVEFLESGVNNILCMQPFGCLPNHITAKGTIKALKKRYPSANIAAVDYDPGASEVNQLNRIKLLMTVAHQNL